MTEPDRDEEDLVWRDQFERDRVLAEDDADETPRESP